MGNPEFNNMTREDFMILALGADRDRLMEVVHMLVSKAGLPLDSSQTEAMYEGIADPDYRMEIATMLADGAERSGVFG